jgi:hypothetical protein
LIVAGTILQIQGKFLGKRIFTGDANTGNIVIDNLITYNELEVGLDVDKQWLASKTTMPTLSSLLDKSKSYVGVFATLYSSLLNFTDI